MKKTLTLLALASLALGASAQQPALLGSKFLDNWSIGIDGGISTNLHDWDTPRGAVTGLQLTKAITPVFSIELSGQAGFNDNANWNAQHSPLVVDNFTALVSGKVNLMNWIGGYKGSPRVFDIQVRGGAGFMGAFYNEDVGTQHFAVVKVGLDFDFNLGEKRAWTLSVRPALALKTKKEGAQCDLGDCRGYTHNALGQLTAGISYHFKNSNGTHSFARASLRDQAEIDNLNDIIRRTQAQADKEREDARRALDEKDREIEALRTSLNECESREPVKEVSSEKSLECYVYFGQGRTTIDASQQPNVERIATFMRSHSDARVVIFGYASPEGSPEINESLAEQRALAVKISLVKKYGINPARIDASGKGVGDSFSEPDWNRVSICTIINEDN